FDPLGEYLKPPLQGYRLRKGVYHPIRAVNGRFRSEVLGLHLERSGRDLRLWDPRIQQWLPTTAEREHLAEQLAEDARQLAEDAQQRAEDAQQRAKDAQLRAEAATRQAEAVEFARREAEERATALAAELERIRTVSTPPSGTE